MDGASCVEARIVVLSDGSNVVMVEIDMRSDVTGSELCKSLLFIFEIGDVVGPLQCLGPPHRKHRRGLTFNRALNATT